jgi:uncharacterized membrane protein YcaP (DUF421 family)
MEFRLFDIHRLLFGDATAIFILEVIIRVLTIYFLLITSLRLMGQRMSSGLGRNELIGIVTLAAAIGVPLQVPDRGLVPSLIIATIVILFERIISKLSSSNKRFEKLFLGDVAIILKDSCMDFTEMKKCRINRERLLAQLRSKQVKQLGEVNRVYLEANGGFSIVKSESPRSGLSIIPKFDMEFEDELRIDKNKLVCERCGHEQKENNSACKNCGNASKFIYAVK